MLDDDDDLKELYVESNLRKYEERITIKPEDIASIVNRQARYTNWLFELERRYRLLPPLSVNELMDYITSSYDDYLLYDFDFRRPSRRFLAIMTKFLKQNGVTPVYPGSKFKGSKIKRVVILDEDLIRCDEYPNGSGCLTLTKLLQSICMENRIEEFYIIRFSYEYIISHGLLSWPLIAVECDESSDYAPVLETEHVEFLEFIDRLLNEEIRAGVVPSIFMIFDSENLFHFSENLGKLIDSKEDVANTIKTFIKGLVITPYILCVVVIKDKRKLFHHPFLEETCCKIGDEFIPCKVYKLQE